MRQIFFDTETTGLKTKDGHRIIELALVEVIAGKETGKHLHMYFNPDRSIDPEAQRVHGIGLEQLKDKHRFKQHADEILDFIKGAELVAHNAPFDADFMNAELQKMGSPKTFWECCAKVTDTLDLAKKFYPGKKNSLDALCDRLGIDRSHRTAHGALLDTQLLVQVYARMKEENPNLEAARKNYDTLPERTPVERLASNPARKVIMANSTELGAHAAFMAEITPKTESKNDKNQSQRPKM